MAEVVIVTGGSAGIGRAAARMFARRGDSVGLIARGQERLDDARRELEALGVKAHAVSADVSDAAALEHAAGEIETALGPVTVWVNNAMATIYAPIAEADEAEIKRVTDVTYLGAVNGTKAALRRMRDRRGVIVQVSSVLSWRAMPVQGPYCAAKFALRGFTESLRSELMHDRSKVRLSMVHLPAVNTPQFSWARNKTGRRAKAPDTVYTPDAAARAIVFAATRPRRDVWVGRGTPATIIAAGLVPSLLDRVLARKGYDAMLGEPGAVVDGNLFEPVPGHQSGAGPFGDRARDSEEMLTSREAGVAWAGLVLLGAIGLSALVTAPVTAPLALARSRRR